MRALAKRTLAEILGLSQGFRKGRGGLMHLRWLAFGIPAFRVDGMDAIAVSLAGTAANQIMRAGAGPT